MQKRTSMMVCAFALAMYASADVRNIRPPTTGEGKLGTTTYKWGEVHANDGYYSNLILGGLNITNKFLSPYDGAAGEVFYANGLGGGVWGAASSPSNGISKAVADATYASIGQGARADSALLKDGSEAMTGDLDMDGYGIKDAGIVYVDGIKMNPPSGTTIMSTIQMPLALALDAKCGYNGTGDYIGAADGVGFYCVDSANTNRFSLAYLTTNNYIMVQSPLIHATSNYIEKITGFGTCASNDYPVAGLSIGDNYVTFPHSGTIGRTNLVTYTRFGSNLATVNPSFDYAGSSINLHIIGFTGAGIRRNENINVFIVWAQNTTTPVHVEVSSMMRTDYPMKNFIDVRNYNNQLIMFGLYDTNAYDNRRIERRYMMCVASAVCRSVTITSN